MGKEWDGHKGGRAQWVEWMTAVMAECLRVLKPGGHALVWALPRTAHWTACAVEDAGFEIRDKVYHLFGSGFPKSLDIGKAIDKMAGAERDVTGWYQRPDGTDRNYEEWIGRVDSNSAHDWHPQKQTAPAPPAAVQWDGWHTALKPAVEEWILARKPIEGTVAANVLKYGTGGLNVGACRVPSNGEWLGGGMENGTSKVSEGWDRPWRSDPATIQRNKEEQAERIARASATGRYPAHLIHDGSPDVLAGFPQSTSTGGSGPASYANGDNLYSGYASRKSASLGGFGDTGSAARFFQVCPPDDDAPARWLYAAKASKKDRDEGLEGWPEVRSNPYGEGSEGVGLTGYYKNRQNTHPTVKPTALMRYLCRLITPPGGVILDPFAGSGSTGKGAILEGFSFIGIEQDSDYADIARARIAKAAEQARQLELL